MNWTTWWLFATTVTLVCLTPGPAVLFVLSSALRSGPRKSIGSNLGILAANTVYFILSATSIGALLVASHKVYSAVKWIGAAYLILLGLRALLSKDGLLAQPDDSSELGGAWRFFVSGFLVQASNPNAIVFFGALVPQFINTEVPVVPQMAILAVTTAVVEFSVLLGYGLAAGRASQWARESRYARVTNREAGAFLIAAGVGIAER